ncbi:M20 family metallo-hydrolase [Amycolatopsis jejuensis]|uniref:M20 family metallo-hydrolase n=1 Tax=Amycolatopsis jejuensis TaxID=330084 RepID=UPI00068A7537|nr:M20 family metallo-hydrolase [Amycolatopsis jejuensis]
MTQGIARLEPVRERISRDLHELAEIREPDHLGWTRRVFSEPYRLAREWVTARMRDAGLEVRRDGAGNLVGVLPGRSPAAPALITGSHTDTVQGGGRFDGIVGVLGAIEVARLLRESGRQLDRDLVVVDFLGEESNDWRLSCLGSRALAGELTRADLDRQDGTGAALGGQFAAFGIDPSAALGEDWLRRRPVHGYVELHVEQGPVLEQRGAAIGVVTAIAGIERLLATFRGQADHAGTRPMGDRRDALVAAAEAVLAVERTGCGAPVHGVATASEAANVRAAPNVVPELIELRAEMRSVDTGWLGTARERLAGDIIAAAQARGVDVSLDWITDNEVVQASKPIQDVIAEEAGAAGIAWEAVPSGATHDAVHMARWCPMGMIFVPSKGGRSHCPEEATGLGDIVHGVRLLAATMCSLDARP